MTARKRYTNRDDKWLTNSSSNSSNSTSTSTKSNRIYNVARGVTTATKGLRRTYVTKPSALQRTPNQPHGSSVEPQPLPLSHEGPKVHR